jgi:zinc/manganese transport system substrate-binding protein
VRVVTTLPVLGDVARQVGRDLVTVVVLARPGEDPHAIEATPAHGLALRQADVFVENGVQLELWAERALDAAENPRIAPGQPGHVFAATGCQPLEVPTAAEVAAGGHVHGAGNPHVWLDPLNLIIAATNIERALVAARPASAEAFRKNREAFAARVDDAYFGAELVKVLGAAQLERLQRSGRLVAFLGEKAYKGKPLLDLAGGWLRQGLDLGGLKVVAYHRTWPFLGWAFGLETVGTIEEKPGIPPSPEHLSKLTTAAQAARVRVAICAPYEPLTRAEGVAERLPGVAVVLPTQPGEGEGTADVFALFDRILAVLADAKRRADAP